MVIGSKYAYSFGRVRALETSLVDRAQFKRMVEAPTAAEAMKVLSETAYAALPERADIPAIEKVLQDELLNVYDLAQHVSPKREITDLLQLKHDFHNAKILLKAEAAGVEPAHLVPLGTVDVERMKKALKERLKDLPESLVRAVEKARLRYGETADTQIIDLVMDQEYALTLLEQSADVPFLKEFFELKIDLENIRNFVRCQRYEVDFEKVFLQGGTVDFKTFSKLQGESLEVLINTVRTRKYSQVVEEGLKEYEETKSMTLYERLCEDFLIEYARQARMVTLGIEPLLAYIMAKEREVKLIRLILVGKLKGVDVEKRMRDPYV